MSYYSGDVLGDNWAKYEVNVPPEVMSMFSEPISPYGTERIVLEDGQLKTEVYVSAIERKTLQTVEISSVASAFINFSLTPLECDSSALIDAMLSTEVVVTETVGESGYDNSLAFLDYAIFDDPQISHIAIRNPSAGTVSRIQELKRRESTLEYVLLATESYKETEYFKEVQQRIRGSARILDYEQFEDKHKRKFVLYVGLSGNDIHMITEKERSKYKNVMGWAVNPFSVFNCHNVNSMIRTSRYYEFEYDRKNWTRIERYWHDPKCFRYSSQASVAYIQDRTKFDYAYDKHLLCTHRYIPLAEGQEASLMYAGAVHRCYIPCREELEKSRRTHELFGEIDVYSKNGIIYDIGLPFPFTDRYKYIRAMNDQEPRDHISVVLSSVSEGYVYGKGNPPTSFVEIECLNYTFYNGDGDACKFKDAEVVKIDGKRYPIEPSDRRCYSYKGSAGYYLYLPLDQLAKFKMKKCYEQKIQMVCCPISEDGEYYLVSSETGMPTPPYLDNLDIPRYHMGKQALHYNDFVTKGDKRPVINYDISFIDE